MFFNQREIKWECPAEILLGNKIRIVGLFLSGIWFLNNFQRLSSFFAVVVVCGFGFFLGGFFHVCHFGFSFSFPK